MSAPFVSGLVRLLATEYSYFTHSQIRATILRYVDVVPSLQGLVATDGRINAFTWAILYEFLRVTTHPRGNATAMASQSRQGA